MEIISMKNFSPKISIYQINLSTLAISILRLVLGIPIRLACARKLAPPCAQATWRHVAQANLSQTPAFSKIPPFAGPPVLSATAGAPLLYATAKSRTSSASMAISFTSRCPFSVSTGTATTRGSSPVFRISLAKPISHPSLPSLSSSIPKQRCSRKSFTIMMGYEAGIGVMGTKLGMMTYFEPEGTVVPVTVIGFGEGNIVTQVKTEATDGYSAVQVGYRRVRDKRLTPEMGHLNKAGAIPMRHLQEFRLLSVEGFESNQRLTCDERFNEGGIKRHNFRRGPMSHGSKSHRALGSIGAGTTPGHVYKGKKMPGRMGGTKTKIRKLKIFEKSQMKTFAIFENAGVWLFACATWRHVAWAHGGATLRAQASRIA